MAADPLRVRFTMLRGMTMGRPAPVLPAWLQVGEALPDLPARAYALARRQFAAEVLLAELPATVRGAALICVTPADLFLEQRPFVFGASMPTRGVAMVSTARLAGVGARLHKVARHELGHLAGLPDCDGDCLMTPAASVEEIDRRRWELCPHCATQLAALPVR